MIVVATKTSSKVNPWRRANATDRIEPHKTPVAARVGQYDADSRRRARGEQQKSSSARVFTRNRGRNRQDGNIFGEFHHALVTRIRRTGDQRAIEPRDCHFNGLLPAFGIVERGVQEAGHIVHRGTDPQAFHAGRNRRIGDAYHQAHHRHHDQHLDQRDARALLPTASSN
jgi:hypothetical protein